MTTLRSAAVLAFASTSLLSSMAHADTPRGGVPSAVNPAAASSANGAFHGDRNVGAGYSASGIFAGSR